MNAVRHLRALRGEDRGAIGLEFAIAIPTFVTLMIGVLQFALVLNASGTMRHAIGEGLRLAKVKPTATVTEVETLAKAQMIGLDPARISGLAFNRSVQGNGAKVGHMTMTYTMRPVIPFAVIPDIVMTEQRRVYLPS